ncbi:MAG: SDR family NAD(P)-dependent oxidoreductase [Candidatus Koribacter versatilis]|uniref:SDR family NAD(P)-dependent oxidoreductase n=1 Tax=Candidatus Korobacter versatilis TaxID=658062 RepID=A0A932A9G7_9BACT|nr:SDR family NAD(P)-dependent oxidoreductase [Candidatus Koribacter versatilis]
MAASSPNPKRVLVTGGAGFVGSHTVDALLAQGHEVRVFDNLAEQVHGAGVLPEYLAKDVEFIRGDMRDIAALRDAVAGVEVVFHLAAAVGVGQSMYQIANYMAANTQGTANLLQALLDRKTKLEKLVVASSMSIYGEGKYLCQHCGEQAPGPRSREQTQAHEWEVKCPRCGQALTPIATDESKPLQCTSVYALSKKDQEELCLLYGRTYGLPVVALRYFNIYGPRQALSNPYTGVAAIFAARLLNRRAPLVFEDGMQMRDFVSVRDVVAANLLAMERAGADGMAMNIGSGSPVSIREVAQTLAQTLGREVASEFTGKYRAGDIRHCFADIGRARRTLGYQPRHSFAEGIRELAEWLRAQSAEDRAAEAAAELEHHGLTA